MTSRTLLSLGLSALVLSGTTLGFSAAGGSIAEAGQRSPADLARRAGKALAKHHPAAVTLAESAVAAAPGNPDYRALLGRSYLAAGRFASARAAFADALQLRPDDGRSALNLVLATIATGDWLAARGLLAAHAERISPDDQGLALALAGDPAAGAALLTQVAREPNATAKTRQNLALTLALSGQWPLARAVAAADMSPADVDGRIADWARFAQPTAASDQVAALLGVRAAADAGQPVALALNAPAIAPTPLAAPVAVAAVAPAAPMLAAAAAAPTPMLAEPAPTPMLTVARITFGPRREVVQPLPAPLLRADGPAKIAVAIHSRGPAAIAAPRTGTWFVQLGAFSDPRVARDAWGRMTRRHASFNGHPPQAAAFRSERGSFYRLSVGGFDRASADTLCQRYRAQGGACFVRRGAGDAVAQWFRKPGMQVASL